MMVTGITNAQRGDLIDALELWRRRHLKHWTQENKKDFAEWSAQYVRYGMLRRRLLMEENRAMPAIRAKR